jgi:hypothetical protein
MSFALCKYIPNELVKEINKVLTTWQHMAKISHTWGTVPTSIVKWHKVKTMT